VDLISAILLGIVEGITEFIPVSSTAHLILAGDLAGWSGETAKTFVVFIQLGAILAVLWLFRTRCLRCLLHMRETSERHFALSLALSFLPAAVLGFILHRAIKQYLFSPIVGGVALVIGGFAILAVERWSRESCSADIDGIPFRKAFGIGLSQCLAFVPGVSRSAATIMGGMALGLPRTTATAYSFFLAIPTMFAATLYDLAVNSSHLGAKDLPIFAAGFLSAFVSALVVVKVFIRFVERHRFTGFALYRIGFGALALIYYICR